MWTDSSPSLAPHTTANVTSAQREVTGGNGTFLQTGGADAAQEELLGGFTLTPGHAAPSNANGTPGRQWTPAQEAHISSPSRPTPRAQEGAPSAGAGAGASAAVVDLERGMTSPWQGPSDGVDGKAVGIAPPPGMMGAGVGVGVGAPPEMIGTAAAALGTGRSGGVLAREQQAGAVRQGVVAGGVERSQGVHQHQYQYQHQPPHPHPQQRQQQRARAPAATPEPVAAQQVRREWQM